MVPAIKPDQHDSLRVVGRNSLGNGFQFVQSAHSQGFCKEAQLKRRCYSAGQLVSQKFWNGLIFHPKHSEHLLWLDPLGLVLTESGLSEIQSGAKFNSTSLSPKSDRFPRLQVIASPRERQSCSEQWTVCSTGEFYLDFPRWFGRLLDVKRSESHFSHRYFFLEKVCCVVFGRSHETRNREVRKKCLSHGSDVWKRQHALFILQWISLGILDVEW